MSRPNYMQIPRTENRMQYIGVLAAFLGHEKLSPQAERDAIDYALRVAVKHTPESQEDAPEQITLTAEQFASEYQRVVKNIAERYDHPDSYPVHVTIRPDGRLGCDTFQTAYTHNSLVHFDDPQEAADYAEFAPEMDLRQLWSDYLDMRIDYLAMLAE